ncbi:MAG TPA: NADH-quinone oxidoreductase subunit J, partial [Prosthecobacter sp.]
LFLGLDAYFIGTIQILVYAGAVMVLFLFIIMLLDIKAEEGKKPNIPAVIGGIVLAVILSLQVTAVCSSFNNGNEMQKNAPLLLKQAGEKSPLPTIANDLKAGTLPDAKLMGLTLFQKYGFHLQVVGLLLLVGTVGVVVLSKREKGARDA